MSNSLDGARPVTTEQQEGEVGEQTSKRPVTVGAQRHHGAKRSRTCSQTPARALKDGPRTRPNHVAINGDPGCFRTYRVVTSGPPIGEGRSGPTFPGSKRFADTASTSLADSGDC